MDGTKYDRADTVGAKRHDAMEQSKADHAADDAKTLSMLQSQLGVDTTGNDRPVPLGLRINPA